MRAGHQRVADAAGGFTPTARCPLAPSLVGSRRKVRLHCRPARARGTIVVAARAPMAGAGERRPAWAAPARGGPGLAVWALLACNAASLALLLLRSGYHVDGRRRGRGRGCPASSGTDGPPAQSDYEDEDEASVARDHAAVAPDAVLNLQPGDPTMYEAFWRGVGDRAAAVIPGWTGMSYTSDAAALCWFLEPALERQVRRLHRLVGNAAVDGYHLVVGNGATQVYQAAMYALSCEPAPGDRRPVPVVSPAPYYSSYPPQTDLQLSGHYRWAGDANAFAGDECIELVCTPNNPDGAVREAVVRSGAGKPIHDLVYYWPQYTPIAGRADHDIMLFTLSKITGHAGTRIGWALVKDRDVARKMVYFVDRSSIGVSRDSQLRATRILEVVSDAYEGASAGGTATAPPPPRLFDFARRRMEERWRALRAAVAASGAFSLQEETSGYCNFAKRTVTACPAFAWLRCDKGGVEDCAEFLAGHNIVARGGEQFGADARHVRVNMLDRDPVFDMLVRRLASIH